MRRRLLLALLSSSLVVLPGISGSIARSDDAGPCGWRRVPSENIHEDGDNLLFDVAAVSSDDVWAVGRHGGLPYYTLIEHWDGTAWTIVPSPNPSAEDNNLVAVSATSANDVWAVGTFFNTQSRAIETLIVHWDGAAWTVVPSPSPGPTLSELGDVVAIGPDDAWAVGSTLDSDPPYPSPPLILHWDGLSWTEVPGPDVGDGAWNSVTATSSNDVWVAGWAGGPTTMHWDGSTWTVLPTSKRSGGLFAISALPSGDAWVAGHTTTRERTIVEYWDGTAWARVRTPNVGDASNNLFGMDAISPDDVWAVGTYWNAEEQAHLPLMLHWDGEQWTATGRRDGPSPSHLSDVAAVSSTDVWAVGWGPSQHRSLTLHYEC